MTDTTAIDQAVAEGGAYEVLRARLVTQGERLRAQAEALNQRRLEQFGASVLEVVGRLRIRTENNCVARDIVQVGDVLLFGYNVFIGLKKETRVEDVFSLYRLVETEDGYDVVSVAAEGTFLASAEFVRDFQELYAYYKNTSLLQLMVRDGKLLACFQIGERLSDMRVFRWSVSPDGREVRYIDNRGERDIAQPAAFDFEWQSTTREMVVHGKNPHLNILDTVFVETTGGDLTLKIENNTEDGLGIYREPVQDKTQSLDDAQIEFARVGDLVLLRILPYREEQHRYLAYNTLTQKVLRLDAMGQACLQLPEDHGIIYPGGYLLQNGQHHRFDAPMQGMMFRRAIRSPNGEDVLYVFHEPESGRYALFTYNLIERRLQPPILCHGYARLEDGRMVIFSTESDEPTRVHPMQVWKTPFCFDEFAARQPAANGFLGRIGNAELVRGISELLSLAQEIQDESVSAQRYSLLVANTRRLPETHHWTSDAQAGEIQPLLHEIATTGESVLDEFEKVEAIRAQSEQALREAQTRQSALLSRLDPDRFEQVQDYTTALQDISAQRGHLLTIRERRYMDVAAIDGMEAELLAANERIGEATGRYLADPAALAPLDARLLQLDKEIQSVNTVAVLREPEGGLKALAAELDILSELMTRISLDDATLRTRVVEAVAGLYARLNQSRARASQRRKQLGSSENIAQFGAQFALFSQAVTSALSAATTPEQCDEHLTRLLVQLEEIESQFGEHPEFLDDILQKREDLTDSFAAHKQTLLDARHRSAQTVHDAASRILDSLARRAERFETPEQLNAFFAGDALIIKLRELSARLRDLKDSVKADDIDARIKAIRDQAVRVQRDRVDLFEGEGNTLRLGRHRFSVNTQALDLTLLARGEGLALHLVGTDYFAPIDDPAFMALKPFWQAALESESPNLTRAEYLVWRVMQQAEENHQPLTEWVRQPELLQGKVREIATTHYRDGYEKGLHDHDACLILQALIPLQETAGVLKYSPTTRALALLCWQGMRHTPNAKHWPLQARSAIHLRTRFGQASAFETLTENLARAFSAQIENTSLPFEAHQAKMAAAYLIEELAIPHGQFTFSQSARTLLELLQSRLDTSLNHDFLSSLKSLHDTPGGAYTLACQWFAALLEGEEPPISAALKPYIPEAAVLLVAGEQLPQQTTMVDLNVTVEGLLSEHAHIQDGRMHLRLFEFFERIERHQREWVEGFKGYQRLRLQTLQRERERLRIEEFTPRPLTSFVRNKLINDSYLPLIGDNLAKQMGAVGENKRSDLMGLLMMISPPGYGKTTLMEYVANRLGLIFMKINGPALGHGVHSLDPDQAPDATARQELQKLNLALEMSNNVMLYVDDIQHTHPEFLQKFISLCDATRRIEGVWNGRTKTYDLRGKKFCVVMAGNPYTESGEVFRIPDMLANRADIYNLGDVLGGMEDAFTLSYLENALTSNPVLAPLATRDMGDFYLLVDKAMGREISTNALTHEYSGAEINEIVETLKRLMTVRDLVYRVNQQYILSAAQADAYRSEPPFKLQGSYRNMNKLAEKIMPVMNDDELVQLLDDHYLGESQLLTTGAEENLLKLAELRGRLTPEKAERWEKIKTDFRRRQSMGGEDEDLGGRVVAQLHDLVQSVREFSKTSVSTTNDSAPWPELVALLERIASEQALARTFGRDTATDAAMWLGGLRNALDQGFKPLVDGMQKRAEQNEAMNVLLRAIARQLDKRPTTPTDNTDK